MKVPSSVIPPLIAIIVYILVDKFFPQKESYIDYSKNPKDLRGGDLDNIKTSLIKKMMEEFIPKLLDNRALKISLVALFSSAAFTYFNSEIQAILSADVFTKLCSKKVDGELKVLCNIIQEYGLDLHTKSIKELIINDKISEIDKINLLKIKLDFIINGEAPDKRTFTIVSIIAIIVTIVFSGLGGLGLFMAALYQLFKEGKISKALYFKILKAVKKKMNLPDVVLPTDLEELIELL